MLLRLLGVLPGTGVFSLFPAGSWRCSARVFLPLLVMSGCAGTEGREYGVDPLSSGSGSSSSTVPVPSGALDARETGAKTEDAGSSSDTPVDASLADSSVVKPKHDAGDANAELDASANPDAADRDAGASSDAANSAPLNSAPVDAEADTAVPPEPTLAPAVSSTVPVANDAGPTCTMLSQQVTDEGQNHTEETVQVTYLNNPPASGTHYGRAANYHAYTEAVPRPYWVHNLEHGAVVFLVGSTATQAQTDAMLAAFDLATDPGCTSISAAPRRVLTPDPLLPTAVAVVAWNYTLTGDCVDADAIQAFVAGRIGQGPEGLVCGGGGYEP